MKFLAHLTLFLNSLISGHFGEATHINSLTLVNANNGNPISGYDPILPGSTVDLSQIGATHLSIRANADSNTTNINFQLDSGGTTTQPAGQFYLCGFYQGVPLPCDQLGTGSHQVTAVPFTDSAGGLTTGASYQLNFAIVPTGARSTSSISSSTAGSSIGTSSSSVVSSTAGSSTGVSSSTVMSSTAGSSTGTPSSSVMSSTVASSTGISSSLGYSSSVASSTGTVTTSASSSTGASVPSKSNLQGMWVWNTRTILTNSTEQNNFVNALIRDQFTDVYLYVVAQDYVNQEANLRSLNARLNQAGIKPWGLEGYRGYFSDAFGPAGLYLAVNQLIAFNQRVASQEQFYGFQSDMEPGDIPGYRTTFHNDIPNSALSKTGGGVWFSTQAQDREKLIEDWVTIYQTINHMLAPENIRFGAALPSWLDDYYGEEVLVTVQGVTQGVMKFMMGLVGDYVILSYSTNLNKVVNVMSGELNYADTLAANLRPRVLGGCETNVGVGATVSYGDNLQKNTKTAVLSDEAAVAALLVSHPSFHGMSLNDWTGWENLRP